MLKKIIPTLVVLALAASLVQAEVLVNEKNPVMWYTWIPCTGDEVILEGFMHVLITGTVDANGGAHGKYKMQPMNLQGEVIWGPNEGAKYNGTGGTQDQWNMKKGETYTFINNYRMIGQGKAPNYMVHETWHVTINANGEVTAVVDNVKVSCKGKPAPSKGDTVTTKWGKIKSQY